MGKLELDVPKDAYNVLSITLDSGRCMYIIIPSGVDANDAERMLEELDELRDIVAGWQSN